MDVSHGQIEARKNFVSTYYWYFGSNNPSVLIRNRILLNNVFYFCFVAVENRIIVENFLKRQHHLEEREILIHEMRNMLNFFCGKISNLLQDCHHSSSGSYNYFQ